MSGVRPKAAVDAGLRRNMSFRSRPSRQARARGEACYRITLKGDVGSAQGDGVIVEGALASGPVHIPGCTVGGAFFSRPV
jgi:hypothetical protein